MIRIGRTLMVLALPLTFSLPAFGQEDTERLINVDAALKGVERSTFEDYKEGKQPPTNTELIKKAAQWYVLRLTWSDYHKPDDPASSKSMHFLVEDAFRQILVPDAKNPIQGIQADYMREFSKALCEVLPRVLNESMPPIVRINAARILGKLGKAGQEETAGPLLLSILNDTLNGQKQLDAVKFYAIKGMKDLFAIGKFKDQTLESACIVELITFLNRKPPFLAAKLVAVPNGGIPLQPGNDNGEEEDESVEERIREFRAAELEGFKYVRREAIRALGQTHYPAGLERQKIVRPTALHLLRVLKEDGFDPPPSMSERVEAALGLCNLETLSLNKYQPDYAAHHMAFFVIDFVSKFNSDRQKPPAQRSEDWKHDAHKLQDAFKNWKADEYVEEMVNQALRILKDVEDEKIVNVQGFLAWVNAKPPKSTTLFKDDPTAVVK